MAESRGFPHQSEHTARSVVGLASVCSSNHPPCQRWHDQTLDQNLSDHTACSHVHVHARASKNVLCAWRLHVHASTCKNALCACHIYMYVLKLSCSLHTHSPTKSTRILLRKFKSNIGNDHVEFWEVIDSKNCWLVARPAGKGLELAKICHIEGGEERRRRRKKKTKTRP